MLNKTMRLLLFIPIAVMLLAGCAKPETPPSIVKLEKQYPEIKKKPQTCSGRNVQFRSLKPKSLHTMLTNAWPN